MLQEVVALEEAKGILISQKLEVQNELDSMQDKIRKVRHTFIIYS
jgi:hypothetical protein